MSFRFNRFNRVSSWINPLYTKEFFHRDLDGFIMHNKGSHVRIAKLRCTCTSVPGDCFYYANSADADEMPHYVAFHLGLH